MKNTAKTTGKPDIKSTIKAAQTQSVSNILHLLTIRDEEGYQNALAVMEYLMLHAPDSDDNPYHNLMLLLGNALEAYENIHSPVPASSGIEVLSFLMSEHQLKQADLIPVLGSRSLISELLSGKRVLNKRHIQVLSDYFKISPALLMG